MFEVTSIMKTDVITVNKNTPIYEAVKTLVANNITGLPVIDDDGNLVGIVTEKDVIKLLSDLDVLRLLSNLETSAATVEDFMTTDVTSFTSQANLIEICDCLMENNFRRIPVVDDGKVTGIISRKDIIAYILKLGGEHEFIE